MNSYKYFLKNVGLLTFSNFATKLLAFFLVPLYTNVLTTTEYGTYDLFSTTVSLMVPILTLNIFDGVSRYALERYYDKSAIVTISAKYFIRSCIFLISLILVNVVLNINIIFAKYGIYFVLMFGVQALSGIVLGYTRGIDKISDLSISSVITSAITIGCNIIFLLIFKWGLEGYFIANIIGPAFQCVYLIIKDSALKKLNFKKNYKKEEKELLDYSKPLIANTVSWWVNSAADKYIVVWVCGLAANGIYSVASKIPTILNVFQSIFSQAWTLSAVKDFDPEDKNGFFKNMYASYNCIMTLLCSVIIVGDKVLAKILYAKDFYNAWIYVPWLTIAIVFGAMAGYIGGIYTAVKEPKILAKSSIIGAIINGILNFTMTPIIGVMGAAVATTISYFIIWLIRYLNVTKYIKLKIFLQRDLLSYALLVMQAIVMVIIDKNVMLYLLQICTLLVIVVLYRNDIELVTRKVIRR